MDIPDVVNDAAQAAIDVALLDLVLTSVGPDLWST